MVLGLLRQQELTGGADVHFMDFLQDYDAFYRRFAGFGFDIGLAPLPDDEFYRAKSNNKFREYAASRVAGIYSDMVVYRDCVDDGRTGLLVPDVPDGWFTAMGRLIDDGPLRGRIQQEAFMYARERYGVAQAAEAWLTHIDAARTRREETPSPGRPVGQPIDLAGPRPPPPRPGCRAWRAVSSKSCRDNPRPPRFPSRKGSHGICVRWSPWPGSERSWPARDGRPVTRATTCQSRGSRKGDRLCGRAGSMTRLMSEC